MVSTTTFGQWLKQRRKALGLTQKTLAQRAGCAEVTLRKIESGDLQPSAALVASLAEALGMDEGDLPGLVSLARGTGDGLTVRTRLLRPQRPNNLPAQLTPLIGRESDITAVRRRLLADGARLVTLVGPPGVGKTRLSLAVAEDVLEQFEDGVFFVRLAPVSDPDQVASAIAQALGMQMSGPNPPELQLRAYLEEKHLLLVLDNFEQIVAAAPLVDDLLRRCPWLHVLVTSRQPLRVRGERQMTVQPLALPASAPAGSVAKAEDMLRYPAVELFADRAEAVLPDFAVDDGNAAAVAELCRRLDGLPLAIELVAARVKLLPPAELLGRLHGPWLLSTDGLRDVSARQKTLRGAIGWSYDLLSPAEQTLFRFLSIFVGGFTLEAAELLCGDALTPALPLAFSPTQVLDGIASLLDKNLLRRYAGLRGESRYMMLETVREYGLECLDENLEEALRERHARCFLKLIERAEKTPPEPNVRQVRRVIDYDLHNVRAAHFWSMKHHVQAALVFATAMIERLSTQGPYSEGLQIMDAVFNLPGATERTVHRARALFEAGILVLFCGDPTKAQTYEEESLSISQELGYIEGEADALYGLGRVASSGWLDVGAAELYFEKAHKLYANLQNAVGVSLATSLLGMIAYWQNDFEKARILCNESLSIARQVGHSTAWPMVLLSSMALAEGNLQEAKTMSIEVLPLLEAAGSTVMAANMYGNLGIIATHEGDFAAARTFLEDALALRQKLGDTQKQHVVTIQMASLYQAEGRYERAMLIYRQIFAEDVDPHARDGYLLGLATLAGKFHQHVVVSRLLGAIDAVKSLERLPLALDDRRIVEFLAREASAQLGDARLRILQQEGRDQTFEQAVEQGLLILEEVILQENRTTS